MARILSCSAATATALASHWECTETAPDLASGPTELPADSTWYPAQVPGTYATALRDSGAWDGTAPLDLDNRDIWYRTSFVGAGEETLCFEGLATIAEVWLNGVLVLQSDSMFQPGGIELCSLSENQVYICFRSLTAWLQRQKGRARWRTRLAIPGGLRFARTTLLGRMPGWCPGVQPVGPWRPVLRRRFSGRFRPRSLDARASVDQGHGCLTLHIELEREAPDPVDARVEIGGHVGRLERLTTTRFAATIIVPNVALWWPHTHGPPHMYAATLFLDDIRFDLGTIGFRSITTERGDDGNGFGLCVNGVPIFCRGACWTTVDLSALPGDAARYRPLLEELRNAGMNMVRIAGTMVYESDEFYALCDELGLLVWQDAMLASFDYPATPAFRSTLVAELECFLGRTQLNPSLAVFCGGSEGYQQAAMFGLPSDRIDHELYETVVPEVVGRCRPDIVYVPNSPSGGDLPFQPNAGVAHYYGVGAYLRPLSDARTASVRFASECLALANVPCARTMDALGVSSTTDPRWKAAVPRDPGAGWDFDDVRDHYLAMLFRVDPTRLRYSDMLRYLELSRAVSCILALEVFNEWRRLGSSCRGALVWQWNDVSPGAGWGVLDSFGRRKPIWYALRRACRNCQVILTDEGLNGLEAHVINESDSALRAVLRLTCLRMEGTTIRKAEQQIELQPRAAMSLGSGALLDRFFDITYCYQFGPRTHDVTVAGLHDAATDDLLAEAYHFPDLTIFEPSDIGLDALLERQANGWSLRLVSRRFAYFLHIDDPGFVPDDDWLHLVPGRERCVMLLPRADPGAVPHGEIRALNMDRVVRYTVNA